MNKWIRRGVVGAVILGVMFGVFTWATPKDPWCKITDNYAASLSADDLPQNLGEFVEIPTKYRRAVLNIIPAEVAAVIIRESLQEAAQSGKLNAEQKMLVERAIPHISAAAYVTARNRGSNSDVEALRAVEDQLNTAFTRREWNSLVSPLERKQTIPTFAWALPTLRQAVNSMVATVSASPEECNCTQANNQPAGWSWNCVMEISYCNNVDTCRETFFCGAIMLNWCDGVCRASN